MYLTTEEAKNKWCPVTQENQYPDFEARCRAHKCMAWRPELGMFCLDKQRFLQNGESTREGGYETRSTGRGYCGLAGEPQ